MEIISAQIPDVKIIVPKVWDDSRGYFYESYNQKFFTEHIGPISFVQDNQSLSAKGTFRGLHYQMPPFAQAKLVRVVRGSVLDIAVDIRMDSPTFGMSVTVELNEKNNKQLFIPHGFAHGFLVLSEEAIFQYKVDNFYAKDFDRGICIKDPNLKLNLPFELSKLNLSEKDMNLPTLKDAEIFTGYGKK